MNKAQKTIIALGRGSNPEFGNIDDVGVEFAKAQRHWDNMCPSEQFDCPNCGTTYDDINPLEFKCDECGLESEPFDPCCR